MPRLAGLLVVLLLFVSSLALAEASDAGAPAGDAGASPSAASDAGVKPDARVSELRLRARRIRDLIAGKRALAVDPADALEPQPADEDAVRVEVERLRAIVAWADGSETDAGAPQLEPPKPPKPGAKPKAKADAGAADPGSDAGPAEYAKLRKLDPDLWEAQVELDRARLAYFSLPLDERNALLAKHAERQKGDSASKEESQLNEAERKAKRATEEREEALETAKRARTAAARLVAEERARLLDIQKQQAEFEAELVRREQKLKTQKDDVLALRQRVRDVVTTRPGQDVAGADALYVEVRRSLRQARDDLAGACAVIAGFESTVPRAGQDPLSELGSGVDRSAADQARQRVESGATKLGKREEALERERAQELYSQVESLNGDRLALLPFLSDSKRSAVTGLGPAGIDQAAAELRQVWLVLRYHVTVTSHWIVTLRSGEGRERSAISATVLLIKGLLPILVFVFWRRRAGTTLRAVRDGLKESRLAASKIRRPGPLEQAVNLAIRIRGPLEWLVLIWAVVWLLPAEATGLLEVKLLTTITNWTLGGSMVVIVIDFLAGEDPEHQRRKSRLQTAHLRYRSLRLIGRVVVTFALLSALTSQLVGKGTIYGWVTNFCWLAALPVLFVVVRWWRAVIFERVELERRKHAVHRWVSEHQSGWMSVPAALLGGLTLFGEGAYRFGRNWVSGFELSRRILAYLFRREISKKAENNRLAALAPLTGRSFELLGPATRSEKLVPSIADAAVDEVIARINAPGGGVFAVVGERGAGKTTLLKRIAQEVEHVALTSCPFGGMENFAPALAETLGGERDELLEDVAARFDVPSHDDAGILVDDAHRLIQPMMGGMRSFDRVLAVARRHSKNVAWVFAFDEVIWRFFERMRGARPLFDDVVRLQPWGDEEIAKLLRQRSHRAELQPNFEALLGALEQDGVEDTDREQALADTEANYYRLIWDYAAGNPGVALHVWRSSLGTDDQGATQVRLFQAPSAQELEELPDSAVFVLRALVQLERADALALSRASGIGLSEVEDALRFGAARGYFVVTEQGYEVAWNWFRAITRLLQRRHLLFSGRGTT